MRKNWSSGRFSKSSKLPLNDQFRCCIISSRSMSAMFFNCPTMSPLFSSVYRISIAFANCFWEDNVVRFVFAKRFDELGIWMMFSNELFQMLALV